MQNVYGFYWFFFKDKSLLKVCKVFANFVSEFPNILSAFSIDFLQATARWKFTECLRILCQKVVRFFVASNSFRGCRMFTDFVGFLKDKCSPKVCRTFANFMQGFFQIPAAFSVAFLMDKSAQEVSTRLASFLPKFRQNFGWFSAYKCQQIVCRIFADSVTEFRHILGTFFADNNHLAN